MKEKGGSQLFKNCRICSTVVMQKVPNSVMIVSYFHISSTSLDADMLEYLLKQLV